MNRQTTGARARAINIITRLYGADLAIEIVQETAGANDNNAFWAQLTREEITRRADLYVYAMTN